MPKSRPNPPRKTTRCPNCNGKGYRKIDGTHPCRTCNQTGIIPEPKRSR